MFKAYTRKSSAVAGAKRAGLDEAAVMQQEGVWGFHIPEHVAVAKLPRLNSSASSKAQGESTDRVVEAIHQSSLSVDVAIAQSAAAVANHIGGLLGDIRDLLSDQNSIAVRTAQADKLNQLEEDREKKNIKNSASNGFSFLPGLKDSTKGLFDMVKMMSLPFIIGALTEIDKAFDVIGGAKDKISKWAGNAQRFLDVAAELPIFKDNVLGAGIRNLFPILGAVGLFAAWKPDLAVKGIQGLFKAISFLGKNPSLGGAAGVGEAGGMLSKLSRVVGKIAIPITIVTSLYESITSAFTGWQRDGAFGAFEGLVDGLVHGLIGGLIDTLSSGIGWMLDKFGVDAQRFKDFSFANFLDAFGTNLGVALFDVVDDIKSVLSEAVQGFKDLWNADTTIFAKIMDMVTYPFKFLFDKFKQEFGGLSPLDAFKKMLAYATGNHAALRAVMSASEPAPGTAAAPPAIQQWPTVQAVISPQPSVTGLLTGTSSDRLEAQARKAGLSQAQIDYSYETDRLIGAPKGASLAQLKQESSFRNDARSPTGAVGISQFTNVGVDDVLFGRKAANEAERAQRAAAKQSLVGNTDKGLEYQRALLQKIQGRSGDNWQSVMRSYNGDVKLESNGMQARDNYIARIKGYLTNDDATAKQRAVTGERLSNATEQASDAKNKASGGGAAVIAPVNNSRTNVSNVTQNHLPNLNASTPVEFAPFVV